MELLSFGVDVFCALFVCVPYPGKAGVQLRDFGFVLDIEGTVPAGGGEGCTGLGGFFAGDVH